MFYNTTTRDYIRVPPASLNLEIETAVLKEIKNKYNNYVSKEMGIVIEVSDIKKIGEGVIIPGDGAVYYETEFSLLVFQPEVQEILPGKIQDIADFGAFINLGPIDGMIHISQTMNDFVSFTKEKVLQGKDKNRTLKVGDLCFARIVAVSYKDVANPKIGLTMRQEGLGKPEWILQDFEEKETKKIKVQEKKSKR